MITIPASKIFDDPKVCKCPKCGNELSVIYDGSISITFCEKCMDTEGEDYDF